MWVELGEILLVIYTDYTGRWSGWLVFYAKWASCQISQAMMTMSTFYQTNTLSLSFIVLAHWNNRSRVDMSLHSDTLFCFRANQSLVLFLNYALLAEKQQIPIIYSLVWADHWSNPRSTAPKTKTLTITPPMQFIGWWKPHYPAITSTEEINDLS